jgi:uncharacterized membrane protein YdjX (TVP38/TMEM64 family)
MLVVAWLLAELLIQATYPEAVEAKRTTDVVFFYTLGTRLPLFPTPFELVLTGAYRVLGFIPTVAIAGAAAVVGSWLIFIIGGEANKGVKRAIENNPTLDRGFRWLERNARRYGYVVLGLLLSIPFAPDTLPLILFAMLNLQLKWFLLTVFVSTVVRTTAFLFVWPLLF